MKSLSTTKLLTALRKSNDIDQFLKDNCCDLNNPTLSAHLKQLLDAHGLKPTDLSNAALLDRSFTYQLINGTRIPNRNILLRFSFVLHLSLQEVQNLLRISQKGELYPRVLRDTLLIYAIEQNLSLLDANDLLLQYNQSPLLFEEY